MFHKVSPANLIITPVTVPKPIYHQSGHLCCVLPWREKGLAACPEGQIQEKRNDKEKDALNSSYKNV